MSGNRGGFRIDPDALNRAAEQLHARADEVEGHGRTLAGKTGGRVGHGPIGQVAEDMVKRGLRAAGEGVSKAVADFHRDTAKGLKAAATRTTQADARAAKSFTDLQRVNRHEVPRPGGAAVRTDPTRVDRGDGRDSLGHFTGAGGYGKSGEAKGLVTYKEATGRDVIAQQIGVTTKDGGKRFYDGLSLKPDGTYEGVEVKSGSASPNAHQRAFDASVNSGTPAKGMLNGKPITVTSVRLIQVDS
jgi:hypothetical protein